LISFPCCEAGDDTIEGGAGDDAITGDDGKDAIWGDADGNSTGFAQTAFAIIDDLSSITDPAGLFGDIIVM